MFQNRSSKSFLLSPLRSAKAGAPALRAVQIAINNLVNIYSEELEKPWDYRQKK